MSRTKTISPPFPPRLYADLADLESHELESEEHLEASLITNLTTDGEADYVEITESRLSGVRLTGAAFRDLSLVDVVLEDCELSGAILTTARLVRVQFIRCRLSGVYAAGLKAHDVRFEECRMEDANLRMGDWHRCELIDCDLESADFTSTTLAEVQFRNCVLNGAHFTNTNCKTVTLFDSQLEAINGVDGLRGAAIRSEQVLPLAFPMLRHLGIDVQDG